MACGISFEATATSTVLFLLVLLQAALVWDEVHGAPAKRNDILAGTEFLSVFINGAMATPPQRRRGFRRGGHTSSTGDSATAESHQHEASIYRISRNPGNKQVVPRARNTSGREEVVRFYPISHKTLENRQQNLASLIDELSTTSDISSTRLAPQSSISTTTVTSTTAQEKSPSRTNATSNSTNKAVSRQKVIGVSVTSTVEATPYKVRVEHYDNTDATVVSRPPSSIGISSKDVTKELKNGTTRPPTTRTMSSTTARTLTTTTTTTTTTTSKSPRMTTPSSSSFVTEELSNIVSESNRSEFSVDEGSLSTSWRVQSSVTPRSMNKHTPSFVEHQKEINNNNNNNTNNPSGDMITLPTEENYELPEENAESKEFSEEPMEVQSERYQAQGRKAGRHFDASHYNRPGSKMYSQPSKSYKSPRPYSEPAKLYSESAKGYNEPEKIYGEPAKVYSEPAKVYSEPAKVYSEPAKVYSEPAKVYGEPEKVYSEPSKVYSEPAKVYSEPAKVYSQPAQVYSEPSKLYDSEGQPLSRERGGEPDEQNYEVDESVSVSSNGNVHGPQIMLTEPSNASEVEDGHKVGYVVEGRNYRKYRVEERTPDGFIVGEYGVVSHDDGSLRGVRYTADGTINPRLIYDALMKFLAL
ncbi:mucin-5AC-like isoform X1 [Bombus huntii]|uniref:mucin-5AC-like isoform X1 n=2 Tax=Bombus huntii TaxID=85661 RepID=UPI0021A9A423|nr:mucin-5AC-like isoform X1 [Bombus huntii]